MQQQYSSAMVPWHRSECSARKHGARHRDRFGFGPAVTAEAQVAAAALVAAFRPRSPALAHSLPSAQSSSAAVPGPPGLIERLFLN